MILKEKKRRKKQGSDSNFLKMNPAPQVCVRKQLTDIWVIQGHRQNQNHVIFEGPSPNAIMLLVLNLILN